MPMGLTNSPASYMHMINFKLKGLIGKICFAYVDDLIGCVWMDEKRTHVEFKNGISMSTLFHLKLNLDKCSFLQRALEYLGHKVSSNGITPLERNVEKVLNFPQPKKS